MNAKATQAARTSPRPEQKPPEPAQKPPAADARPRPKFAANRSHGVITPISDGIAFEQDGAFFGPQGDFVRWNPDAPPPPKENAPGGDAPARRPPWRRRTRLPAPAQPRRRRLYPSEQGFEEQQERLKADQNFAPEEPASNIVNLRAWALEGHKYLFAEVAAAILEQFDARVTDEGAALRVMHEKGVINDDEYDQVTGGR